MLNVECGMWNGSLASGSCRLEASTQSVIADLPLTKEVP